MNFNTIEYLARECYDLMSKGTLKQLQAAQTLLVKEIEPAIQGKTNKYRYFSNYEDFQQIGRECILLALRTFDPGKGAFWPWVEQYMNLNISRAAAYNPIFYIPINKRTAELSGKWEKLHDFVEENDSFEKICTQINIKKLEKAIEKLPPIYKQMIKFIYIEELPVVEIRKISKLDFYHCNRRHDRAIKILKHNFLNESGHNPIS